MDNSSEIIIYGTHSQQSYEISDLNGDITLKLPYTTQPGSISVSGDASIIAKYPTKIGCDVVVNETYAGKLFKIDGKTVTILSERGGFIRFRKYETIWMDDQDVSLTISGIGNYTFSFDFGGLTWSPMNKVFLNQDNVRLELGATVNNNTVETYEAMKTIFFQTEHNIDEDPTTLTLDGSNVIEPGIKWIKLEERTTSVLRKNILDRERMIVDTVFEIGLNRPIPAGVYKIYRNIDGRPIFFKEVESPKMPENGIFAIKKKMTNVRLYEEDGNIRLENHGPAFELHDGAYSYDIMENGRVNLT